MARKSKTPKRTKAQKAADRFRRKVEKSTAPLLANACGDPIALKRSQLIDTVKQHHEARDVADGEECIYCGEPDCRRVDQHGPEWDEQQEQEALHAQERHDQNIRDIAEYDAAYDALHGAVSRATDEVVIPILDQISDQSEFIVTLAEQVTALKRDLGLFALFVTALAVVIVTVCAL